MPAPYSPLDVPMVAYRGVNLTSAADQLQPGEVTLAQNIGTSILGQLSLRAGSDRVGPATGQSSPVHSVFFLNDPVTSYPTKDILFVLGIGTSIYGYNGSGSWTVLATGFSGNPLTAVVYRLSGTGQPWLIIGDSLKMIKVNSQGTVYQLGITPPADVANVTVDDGLVLQIPNPIYGNIGLVITGASGTSGDAATLTSLVRSSNVVTATASGSIDYVAGLPITIQSVTTSFIGTFPVGNVTGGSYWTYAQLGANVTAGLSSATTGILATTNSGATSTISQPESINLAEIQGNPSTTSDSIFAWIYLSDITKASDVQLLFDIDPTSVSGGSLTATAFTKNYYHGSVYSQLSNGWNLVSLQKSAFTRVGQGVYDWSMVVAWQVKCVTVASQTPTYGCAELYLHGAAYPNTSVGVGYDWRYTFYDSVTQSESNPSPIMAVDAYPVNQSVQLLPVDYSTDPQVNEIRWYRRGGTLASNWYLLGAQPNAGPVAITSVIENSIGQVATYSTAPNPHGLSTGDQVYVTGVGNASFNGWLDPITVTSSTTFTVVNTVAGANVTSSGGTVQAGFIDGQSDTEIALAPVLSLQNDVPVTTVNPTTGAIIYGQPLPYIWGPYAGIEIFGAGDPNQPGNMYWCNSTNPDGWGSLNFVEVTQPSDPLTLGVYWQGSGWARSMESLYQINPSQLAGFYTVSDVGSGESVAAPWAVLGGSGLPFMPWVGKSGVFISSGGVGQSITDDKLWPVFNPQLTYGYCIDWTKTQYIRLAFFDHHLRLTYMGRDGTLRTWSYNLVRQYWSGPTIWAFGGTLEFVQPEVQETLLVGGYDGNLYQLDFNATTDNGTAITATLQTAVFKPAGWENDCEFGHINVDSTAPVGGIAVTASFNTTQTSYVSVGSCVNTSRAVTPMGLGDVYSTGASLQFQWTGPGNLFGFSVLWRNDGQKITHAETPPTSFGTLHYGHAYKASVALRSTGSVNLTAVVDNVALAPLVIPSTGNTRLRQDVYFPLNKGQMCQIKLDAATANQGFKVYPEDCSLEWQGWDAIQPTEVQLVFTGGFS